MSSATCHSDPVTHSIPMDRAACMQVLRPHLGVLEGCFRAAWKRWQKWLRALEGSPVDISARSRASVLYDMIVAEAKRSFLLEPSVRVRQVRGLLVLSINDRVALRFKKFRGGTLKTSNNTSTQTALFNTQNLLFPEISIKPMAHLVAGYLLDDLAIDFKRLAVTCSIDGEHVWAPIELTSIAAPVAMLPGSQNQQGLRPKVRSSRKSAKPKKKDGTVD
jgi:hypothetical protein